MLRDFFKLNKPFEIFDFETLVSHLKTSKHICNMLYEPTSFYDQKISGVIFENSSFSKTTIKNTTFKNCSFKDCLFIGTVFEDVEFHDCKFESCNFFKSIFNKVYAKPHQFRKAIADYKYSNIAVHLYHQLRENYYQESQREYKNEAEYYFSHWCRKNNFLQAKIKNYKWYSYWPQYIGSFMYDYLLGYGYRVRNLVITTFLLLIAVIWINYSFSSYLFTASTDCSLAKIIYFTLTTMATIGGSGYDPSTNIGYFLVTGNVIFGISILSAAISAILKKVIR